MSRRSWTKIHRTLTSQGRHKHRLKTEGGNPYPQWIGFGEGDVPDFTLHWEIASEAGWANLPSDVRIPAPGCYAYQVDAQGRSEVIVFQVVGVD